MRGLSAYRGTAASKVKALLDYNEMAWETAPSKREVVRNSNTLIQGGMGRPHPENVYSSGGPDYMLIYFDLKGFFG